MQWSNALSTQPSLESALRDVVQEAQSRLSTAQFQAALVGQMQGSASPETLPNLLYAPAEDPQPDLALLFVSAAFASEYPRVLPLIQSLLDVKVLIGCSGGGIVGGGHEIEADQPAVSLTLAVLPGVELRPFHLDSDQLPDLDASPQRWQQMIGVEASQSPDFILLADGFTSNITDLLQGLDFAYPQAVKVGGLASGARTPGGNALFLAQSGSPARLDREGALGLALWGNVVVDAVVAQGCRPIGRPMQVTEAQRNIILSLEGDPPLQVLQELVNHLSPADQELVRHSLFIGVLMDEFKSQPEPGDFLIRVIMGVDPRLGAVAIGDRIRAGQTVQFHLRDATTSELDLRSVLERYRDRAMPRGGSSAGALMFSCLGRGEQLYDQPDFDSQVFRSIVGELPMGGFFCNGEIGPVGKYTFLHGYTSSFGIFRPAED